MQAIVTDVHSVCLSLRKSVCHSVSFLQPLPNDFGLLLHYSTLLTQWLHGIREILVCPSACHMGGLCENCWTGRRPVWAETRNRLEITVPTVYLCMRFLTHIRWASRHVNFLGCIECMKCRLLLPMCVVSVCHVAQLSFTVRGVIQCSLVFLLS